MSYAQPPWIIHHNFHPHPLTKVDGIGPYICNGCGTYGQGTSYGCGLCNFHIPEFCALYSYSRLRAVVHAPHDLVRFDVAPHPNQRVCNVCNALVQGMFYRCCDGCNFYVHPLCTRSHAGGAWQRILVRGHGPDYGNQAQMNQRPSRGRRALQVATFGLAFAVNTMIGAEILPMPPF